MPLTSICIVASVSTITCVEGHRYCKRPSVNYGRENHGAEPPHTEAGMHTDPRNRRISADHRRCTSTTPYLISDLRCENSPSKSTGGRRHKLSNAALCSLSLLSRVGVIPTDTTLKPKHVFTHSFTLNSWGPTSINPQSALYQ